MSHHSIIEMTHSFDNKHVACKASAAAKEAVQAKGNGAVSKKRGKRGGKRIRLEYFGAGRSRSVGFGRVGRLGR